MMLVAIPKTIEGVDLFRVIDKPLMDLRSVSSRFDTNYVRPGATMSTTTSISQAKQ